MAFKKRQLRETITLPIGDKEYEIESPDVETGLLIQGISEGTALMQAGEEEAAQAVFERTGAKARMDDEEEQEFYERIMGSAVYEELRADGVRMAMLQRITSVIMVWVLQGIGAAEQVWNADGPVEPTAPKSKKKKTTSSSPTT